MQTMTILQKLQSLENAGESLSDILKEQVPPDNCSCHISPPCSNCVEFRHIRKALTEWNDVLQLRTL